MAADYHIHTPYCGHASGKTIEYVERAVSLGLPEIGFSDHLGRYYLTRSQRKRYWDWGMSEQTLSRYYTELTDLREAFASRIRVRIGLEVDFIEGAESFLAPVLALYPFDFLLGSIHCIPALGWQHLAKITSADPVDIYQEYFSAARAAARSGLFQSIAHLDFIWRYVPWPETRSDKTIGDIASVVRAAADSGTCIELNVNAFIWAASHKTDGPDPFDEMLDAVIEHRASVTIGSDAHTPAAVGKQLDDMVAYVKHRGITRQTVFENAVPSTLQL